MILRFPRVVRFPRLPRLCLAVLAAWTISGCATARLVDTPPGFAPYDFGDRFEAISADGVIVRAFIVEPPSFVDAAWPEWRRVDAADRWLVARGATIDARSTPLGSFDTRSGPAIAYEWSTDQSSDEWIVMIAVIVGVDSWIVVEAGGPTDLYRVYEQWVFDAIERTDGVSV
ncbi:MAG: hypothetical protein EA382_13470, partial [Spirochaetaceae bacterium]